MRFLLLCVFTLASLTAHAENGCKEPLSEEKPAVVTTPAAEPANPAAPPAVEPAKPATEPASPWLSERNTERLNCLKRWPAGIALVSSLGALASVKLVEAAQRNLLEGSGGTAGWLETAGEAGAMASAIGAGATLVLAAKCVFWNQANLQPRR